MSESAGASGHGRQLIATLHLVRHGETTANSEGILQGQTDYELSTLGIQQAQVVATHLSSYTYTKIWTSDLTRARHTALAIQEHQTSSARTSIVETPLLREYALGALETYPRGKSIKECRKLRLAQQQIDGICVPEPPTENRTDMLRRCREFMDIIVAAAKECRSSNPSDVPLFLAVSHGGCIHALLTGVMSVPELKALGNCSISVVDIYEDESGNVSYQPQVLDDTSHLNALGIKSAMAVENLLQDE